MKNKILKIAAVLSLLGSPAIASNFFFSLKVPDNSITSPKIADGTITADDVSDNSLTADKFQPGQITVDDDSITSAKIIDGAVTDNDLANGSVTSEKLVDGDVDLIDLGTDSVNSSKIIDGGVDSVDILDNAITSAKVSANTLTADDLADNSVETAELASDSVTTGKVLNGTLLGEDLASDSVTSAKIAAGAVTDNDIANGSITSAKIVDAAVLLGDLAPDSVDTTKIVDGTIDTNDLDNGAVNSDKISDGTVMTADLANDSVDSNVLADNAVLTAKIANGTILDEDIADNAIAPDTLLVANGSSDEACLTYESTGDSFEWASCGGGGASFDQDLNTTDAVTFASATTTGDATIMSSFFGGILFNAGNGDITMPINGDQDTGYLRFDQGFVASDGGLFFIGQEDQQILFSNSEIFLSVSGGGAFKFQEGAFSLPDDNFLCMSADCSVYQTYFTGSTSWMFAGAGVYDFQSAGIAIPSDKFIQYEGTGGDTQFGYDEGNSGLSMTVDGDLVANFSQSDINIAAPLIQFDSTTIQIPAVGTGTGTVLVRDGSSNLVTSTDTYVVENSSPTLGTVTADSIITENFSASAGVKLDPQAVSAGNDVVDPDTVFVHKNAITGGGDTLTLPNPSGQAGKIIVIIDTSGSAGTDNITVLPFGAELINGSASAAISLNYGVLRLQTDGTNWFAF